MHYSRVRTSYGRCNQYSYFGENKKDASFIMLWGLNHFSCRIIFIVIIISFSEISVLTN